MAYGEADVSGYVYKPKTAQADVAEYGEGDALKREDEERAAAAGVSDVAYIDYAEALTNYEDRPDTELLVNRRARENATTFAAQDFARDAVSVAGPVQSSTIGSTTVLFGTTDTNADGDAGALADDDTTPAGTGTDTDGDGVVDTEDTFPDDEGRA